MWVFGYGSLMGDKWEEKFGCVRRSVAVLRGYRRTFNKTSTKNWGSKEFPCPTLNLETAEGSDCKGVAFEFPDSQEAAVRQYLTDREGKGFPLDGGNSSWDRRLASGLKTTHHFYNRVPGPQIREIFCFPLRPLRPLR